MESSFQENTFILIMVIGILIMLALALAFIIFANFSQKKILVEQMRNREMAYQHQEALLHSTILVQEKERKRIARELHDEIGSKLNVIFLNMHRLKKYGPEYPEIETITSEVNSIIDKTINVTRRISHNLLPPTLEDFGLTEAIKELQYSIQQAGDIKIEFETIEKIKRIEDKTIELNLYRILQELIYNSINHGKASNIFIRLKTTPSEIHLTYKDDGIGFDNLQIENQKGLGLKNIESRVQMIKADYQLSSKPGKGMIFKLNKNEL